MNNSDIHNGLIPSGEPHLTPPGFQEPPSSTKVHLVKDVVQNPTVLEESSKADSVAAGVLKEDTVGGERTPATQGRKSRIRNTRAFVERLAEPKQKEKAAEDSTDIDKTEPTSFQSDIANEVHKAEAAFHEAHVEDLPKANEEEKFLDKHTAELRKDVKEVSANLSSPSVSVPEPAEALEPLTTHKALRVRNSTENEAKQVNSAQKTVKLVKGQLVITHPEKEEDQAAQIVGIIHDKHPIYALPDSQAVSHKVGPQLEERRMQEIAAVAQRCQDESLHHIGELTLGKIDKCVHIHSDIPEALIKISKTGQAIKVIPITKAELERNAQTMDEFFLSNLTTQEVEFANNAIQANNLIANGSHKLVGGRKGDDVFMDPTLSEQQKKSIMEKYPSAHYYIFSNDGWRAFQTSVMHNFAEELKKLFEEDLRNSSNASRNSKSFYFEPTQSEDFITSQNLEEPQRSREISLDSIERYERQCEKAAQEQLREYVQWLHKLKEWKKIIRMIIRTEELEKEILEKIIEEKSLSDLLLLHG